MIVFEIKEEEIGGSIALWETMEVMKRGEESKLLEWSGK